MTTKRVANAKTEVEKAKHDELDEVVFFLSKDFCMKLLLEEDPSASKGFLVIQKHVALRGSIPTGSGNLFQNGNHRSFPGVCDLCKFMDIYDGACQLTRTHAVTLYRRKFRSQTSDNMDR
jgi:hypothetical protein